MEKHKENVLKLKESSGEAVVRIETYSRVARSGQSLPRQLGASTKPHRNAPQQRAVLTA